MTQEQEVLALDNTILLLLCNSAPQSTGQHGYPAATYAWHSGTVGKTSSGTLRCSFHRLQPAERNEELVRFGQSLCFELVAVEEAVLLALEPMKITAVTQ